MKIFVAEYNDGEAEPYTFILGAFSSWERVKEVCLEYFLNNAPSEEDDYGQTETEFFDVIGLTIDTLYHATSTRIYNTVRL